MVKVLSRDGFNRMVSKGGGSSAAGGAGGGGGLASVALAQLTDVQLTNLASDDVLVYSSSLSAWVNNSDMATKTWADGRYLKLTGGELTGPLKVLQIELHNSNEINDRIGTLYLQYRGSHGLSLCYNGQAVTTGGDLSVGGDITSNGGDITINEPNSSNSAVLHFKTGNTETGNLRVKPSNNELYFYTGSGQSTPGCMNADWFYAYSQVTAVSDQRKKDIIGDINLSVEDIAKAPAVKFLWKDRRNNKVQVGSIAQYWNEILPESIAEKDGYLTMSYGVIGLISSITLARKVVKQDKKIKAYEKKISTLEARLSKLEKMFAINNNDSED